MGRAKPIGEIDQLEMHLSREFLLKNLEPFINVKLEAQPDSLTMMRNPANGTTYNVYTLSKPEEATGMYKITFVGPRPLHGVAGCTWLVLHIPHLDRVCMIATQDLAKWVGEVATAPQPGWMMGLRKDGDYIHVVLNLDWAVAVKLVRLDGQMKKGSYKYWREKKLAVKENFVHLHNHSMYSLLDGVSTIEGIAEAAMMNGQPAIGITDHGYMFGTYKHWAACTKLGIKPVMGVEAYVVDDVSRKYIAEDGSARRFEFHQTLLAMNQEGWENLCELMTAACRDHFHYVPRIDHRMLFARNAGIICLTGCFKGMAPHYLQRRKPKEGESKLLPWMEYRPDLARVYLKKYKEVFRDRLYGECMAIPDFPQYTDCLPELRGMFAELGIKDVVTQDGHYEKEEDAIIQSIVSRISSQKVDTMGEKSADRGPFFIRSAEQIRAGAPWITDDMMSRTCEIADRCNLSFERKEYLFPHFPLDKDRDWQAFQAAQGRLAT